MTCQNKSLFALRLAMGWLMLWAFLDKAFGLGYSTPPEGAWLSGASPTEGFLLHATQGPFAGIFQAMAGNPFVDWLFMIGLLAIGLCFIFGIGMRIAGFSGALMMVLMWLATLWPEHNPFLDEHLIYALVFLYLPLTESASVCGLGKWWKSLKFVQKWRFLA